MSILLVDDNDDDILLISEAFDQQTALQITHIAHDGEEAMDYLNRRGLYSDETLPGLILLDINMPKMNGFEVLRAVKANPLLQYIPIIMLTTSDREEDVFHSFSSGACSYIHKPPSVREMMSIIQKFSTYWGSVSRVPTAEGR